MRTRLATIVTIVVAAATAVAVLSLVGATTAAATNDDDDQVCAGLSSGKIDTKGDPQSVTVTAPAGKVIVGYCVKAGSEKHGDGPVYVTLAVPVTSLVVRHPSGKAVSHYSLAYVTTTPTPTPTPTVPTPTVPTPTVPTPTVPTPTVPTPTEPAGPFDWEWKYDAPTCDALTVTYPSDLPSGQANDVNIRLETDQGQVTLNY
ncbi:MAG: hypothetical protein JWO11_1909, partial [Nocardioides sp.]|nr:hypothetical protein [Nocardioides sp.]